MRALAPNVVWDLILALPFPDHVTKLWCQLPLYPIGRTTDPPPRYVGTIIREKDLKALTAVLPICKLTVIISGIYFTDSLFSDS